jgi:hypothetical protein
MAWGGILRVIAIYLAAQTLFSLGALDYLTAAVILIMGFVIESLMVMYAARRNTPT